MDKYAHEVTGTIASRTQYYRKWIGSFNFCGVPSRPSRYLPSLAFSCHANVFQLRCYYFVTLSLLSVACASAWSTWQVTHPTPSTIHSLHRSQSSVLGVANRNVWKCIFGTLHSTTSTSAASMTRCHPLEYDVDSRSDAAVVPADTPFKEPSELILQYNGAQYELMPIPDRGKVSTHAIHGTLFKESCIERYDVYRRKHREDTSTSASTDGTGDVTTEVIDHADVVAIVTFGSDLDGHKNIVHGGILALIIDDVLGFGYFAILLREYEGRMQRNSHSNNDKGMPEVTFDPNVVAVTANLNINYRAPVPTNSTVVVEASIMLNDESAETRRESNKFYWNVKAVSLDRTTTYCQGTSLYVIPKRQLLSA